MGAIKKMVAMPAETCMDCTWSKTERCKTCGVGDGKWYCTAEESYREIDTEDGIPDWCPMEVKNVLHTLNHKQ